MKKFSKTILAVILIFTLVLPASAFAYTPSFFDAFGVDFDKVTLKVGESTPVTLTKKDPVKFPANYGDLIYYAADPSVIELTEGAYGFNVKGLKAGKSKFTITHPGYSEVSYEFTVEGKASDNTGSTGGILKEIATITVDKQRLKVSTNYNERTATISIKTKDGSTLDYTATSSKTSVVSVEPVTDKVYVRAVGDGNASVKIESPGYEPVQFDFVVGDGELTGDADLSTDDPTDDEWIDDGEFEEDIPQEILDLQEYADMLISLEKFENTATASYMKNNMVTSKNRKQAYQAFTYTIIPNYNKLVWGAKNIKAPNAELQKLHNQFILGAKLQLEGFYLMKAAIAKPNITSTSFKAANKKISEGYKYIINYNKGLEAYANKYVANL